MVQITSYFGSLPHFVSHGLPVHQALPDEIRGPIHARGRASAYLTERGIPHLGGVPRQAELVMVASYEDYRAVKPSPVILVNHGVGMRYSDAPDHSSYSGGANRERVVLYICPSESDAKVCAESGAMAVAVGTPRLDQHHGQCRHQRVEGEKPVVAWAHHADIHVVPETRWAFPEYREFLIQLARRDDLPFTLIGHAHPRSFAMMSKFWAQLKVEFVPDLDDVFRRCDLFITDNSSAMYEAAAIGIPVLALNASYYRRGVEHNLRFWSHVPGLEVNGPDEVLDGIQEALADPPRLRQKRREAVQVAYTGLNADGHATERAVEAICRLTQDLGTPQRRS